MRVGVKGEPWSDLLPTKASTRKAGFRGQKKKGKEEVGEANRQKGGRGDLRRLPRFGVDGAPEDLHSARVRQHLN